MENQYHSLQRFSSDEDTFADSESMTVGIRKNKSKRRSWRRSRDLQNPALRGRSRTFALSVTFNIFLLLITIVLGFHVKYYHCPESQPATASDLLDDVNGIVPQCKEDETTRLMRLTSFAVTLEKTVFEEDKGYANPWMFEDHSEFRKILKRWRKDMPGKNFKKAPIMAYTDSDHSWTWLCSCGQHLVIFGSPVTVPSSRKLVRWLLYSQPSPVPLHLYDHAVIWSLQVQPRKQGSRHGAPCNTLL